MTRHPETEDHASEPSTIELGLRFLRETPRHLRGPSVPALRKIGLSAKDACEVCRQLNLSMARA
ncbi:hypothetical protein [Mesorhizobium abyssinicae]|uniref:hypothetical protein n=1 Tax=Mesorhizobium abyssinicae TaxID=1209958 RepID=UPI003399DB4A